MPLSHNMWGRFGQSHSVPELQVLRIELVYGSSQSYVSRVMLSGRGNEGAVRFVRSVRSCLPLEIAVVSHRCRGSCLQAREGFLAAAQEAARLKKKFKTQQAVTDALGQVLPRSLRLLLSLDSLSSCVKGNVNYIKQVGLVLAKYFVKLFVICGAARPA